MTARTGRLPRRHARGRTFKLRLFLLSGALLGGLGVPSALAQVKYFRPPVETGSGGSVADQALSTPSPYLMPILTDLSELPAFPGLTLAQKPSQSGAAGANAVKPLSDAEKQNLRALFTKVRPATLRIEQCVPTNCADPDGIGSGVLISADGLALTAYHVVQGARNLSAQTLDKKRYAVQVVGYDDQYDLALLRVAVPGKVPFLPLAAARPAVGDAVLAVGNGGGDFLQPKTGRLTGLDADAGPGGADFPPGTLKMNAPLVPGDSGGAILNTRGEVTGIVSYISVSRDSGPASFAVPVTAGDPHLTDLRAGVKRDAPIIGIGLNGPYTSLLTIDAEDFKRVSALLNLGDTPGAFFTSVNRGSPAEKAGLQPLELNEQSQRVSGDIVTAVNGKRIVNFGEFQYAVRAYKPGDTITLTVLRGSKPLQVKVTLIGRNQR